MVLVKTQAPMSTPPVPVLKMPMASPNLTPTAFLTLKIFDVSAHPTVYTIYMFCISVIPLIYVIYPQTLDANATTFAGPSLTPPE